MGRDKQCKQELSASTHVNIVKMPLLRAANQNARDQTTSCHERRFRGAGASRGPSLSS